MIKLLRVSIRFFFQLPDIPTSEEVPTSISKDDILSSSGKNLIRYSVLAFYCFIFGSEIVYKLARRCRHFLLSFIIGTVISTV